MPKKTFHPIEVFKPLAPSAMLPPRGGCPARGYPRRSFEPSLVHLRNLHQIGFIVVGLDWDNFALNFTFFEKSGLF